jgi:hypothetical protein
MMIPQPMLIFRFCKLILVQWLCEQSDITKAIVDPLNHKVSRIWCSLEDSFIDLWAYGLETKEFQTHQLLIAESSAFQKSSMLTIYQICLF